MQLKGHKIHQQQAILGKSCECWSSFFKFWINFNYSNDQAHSVRRLRSDASILWSSSYKIFRICTEIEDWFACPQRALRLSTTRSRRSALRLWSSYHTFCSIRGLFFIESPTTAEPAVAAELLPRSGGRRQLILVPLQLNFIFLQEHFCECITRELQRILE